MGNAPLFQVVLFILLPMLAIVAGGVIGALTQLGPLVRSAVQHLAAGIVFAAIAGELLPDVIHAHAPVLAAGGFAIGVAAMFGMRQLTERAAEEDNKAARLPLGLIAAVCVDAVLDGLVIGIGFAVGARQGSLIAIALSLEMFFLGLATAATMRGLGVGRPRMFGATIALGLMLGLGAVLGVTLLGGLSSEALSGLLAFGCASLLYLVTEELLNEAHTVKETPLVTSVFFLGFLILFIVEMVI